MEDSDKKEVSKVATEAITTFFKKKEDDEAAEIAKVSADLEKVEKVFFETAPENLVKEYKAMSDNDKAEVLMDIYEDPEGSFSNLSKAVEEAASIEKEGEEGEGGDVDYGSLSDSQKAEVLDGIVAEEQAAEQGTEVKKYVDSELQKKDARIQELEARDNLAKAVQIAKNEIPNFPGTDAEKAALVMAIDQLDDEPAEILTKALKQVEAMMGSGMMNEIGSNLTSSDGIQKSNDDVLNKRAGELAKAEGITETEALIKVLASPEGSRLYSESADAARMGSN